MDVQLLRLLSGILLSLSTPLFIYCQNIIVKPYLQNAGPDQVTIMWEADNVGNGLVEWGNGPFNLSNTVNSTFINGNINTKIHSSTISGLQASSKYYYRVKMLAGAKSYIYHFTTPPTKSSNNRVNFVAISDMQRDVSNPNVYQNLIKNGIIPVTDTALQNGVQDIHGIIIPGDLVQTGGIYDSWRTDFFNLGDSLTPFVPMYPVPGNHEYYSGGLPNFLKYFTLPLNGSASNPEEWWYKDISNVRLIGLNSNSPAGDLSTQLTWLQSVVNDAGNDPDIDFVFAQLHHPYKSELWTPGELDFTGDIISILENFSTTYNKPSLHFFGHTHAYSRGASRDHNHLWVNVATAGGAIDNWGEYPNADYEEFVISEDEYGFVLMEVEAGLDPKFRLRRYTRGDENTSKNNTISDDVTIKRYGYGPQKPIGVYPVNDSILVNCVNLKASLYATLNTFHQASHWQINEICDFNMNNTINIWKQHENWYNEVNTQANDDLTDESVSGLQPNRTYCWRVRYRDQFFNWSDWSNPMTFHTKANTNTITSNLIVNNGAESGITNWVGDIESLSNNECNSVPVFQGLKFFAVGGICANEKAMGIASQTIDVNNFNAIIDAGLCTAEYSAVMRAYSLNNDKPELYLAFLNSNLSLISESPIISNTSATWTAQSMLVTVPTNTRYIRVILKGTRLAGTDNDSYFDDLSLRLIQLSCPNCIGSNLANATDSDGDGICDNLDCASSDSNIFPGQLEVCDGIDNNCDGLIDSGDAVLWTGNGDGINWEDKNNWNQSMLPLPCQHVILNSNGLIKLTKNAEIKSLEIGSNCTLNIQNKAELTIIGMNLNNQASAVIFGTCNNYGRLFTKNSSADGIKISGTLSNQNGALISVDHILMADVIILPTGQLINNSQMDLKE